MCKSNFIHVCFVIDESGSMTGTEGDVIGGFKKVIDEQKANDKGTCSVSYFKFSSSVEEVFIGKDVNDVEYLDGKYNPHGMTALFDGVGMAIDKVGKWLDEMKEEDKPEKNLIVIMTDGGENYSREYSSSKVKEMIKHQEDKYSWEFIYMGSDLTDANDANSLGFSTKLYASKADYSMNYDLINVALTSYRGDCGDAGSKSRRFSKILSEAAVDSTVKYAEKNGLNADELLKNDNE